MGSPGVLGRPWQVQLKAGSGMGAHGAKGATERVFGRSRLLPGSRRHP